MPIIQHHADAIVRDAPPTREHKLYPKYMTHPAYQPGTVGQEVRSPGGFSYYVGGTPIRYPPVLVPDADSEEYHASQGYVSHGSSSAEDFARAVQSMPPPDENYRPQEYPKWVGGVLVHNHAEEERAAHLRRVQLGIDEPEAEPAPEIVPEVEKPVDEAPAVVESNPELTPEPAPPSPESTPLEAQPALLDARMTALETSVTEIKLMFVQFMAQREPQPIPKVAGIAAAYASASTRINNEPQAMAPVREPNPTFPEPLTSEDFKERARLQTEARAAEEKERLALGRAKRLDAERRRAAAKADKPSEAVKVSKPRTKRAGRTSNGQDAQNHAAQAVAAVMATN
jgi:hypothetical protein